MAPEGPEDVAQVGPGEVAHGGPGEEEPEEAGLLGIAKGGLPEAAPAGPVELRGLRRKRKFHHSMSGLWLGPREKGYPPMLEWYIL